MYPSSIENILNDSNKLIAERRELIRYQLVNGSVSILCSVVAELIIRVNMIVKVTQENV